MLRKKLIEPPTMCQPFSHAIHTTPCNLDRAILQMNYETQIRLVITPNSHKSNGQTWIQTRSQHSHSLILAIKNVNFIFWREQLPQKHNVSPSQPLHPSSPQGLSVEILASQQTIGLDSSYSPSQLMHLLQRKTG